MTGMIRKATIFVALGLVASSAAMAGIPSPANCTIPACIKVVGTNSVGVPDSRGTFTVTVLDIGFNAVVGSLVTLNFTACTDMKVCNVGTVGSLPIVPTVVCVPAPPSVTVQALTNTSGVATFTIVGAARHPNTLPFPGPGAGCVVIRADGYLLGTATALDFDLNGAFGAPGYPGNGVTILDLPVWLKDWSGGTGPYVGRSDFNCSGTISILDLPAWLLVWGPGQSAFGCTGRAYCN